MSQQVLDGVRDLLPAIRSRAEETERLRVVPDATIKEIEETGFYRLLQPKRYGGFEADPVDFYTGIKEIAGACGSTGWVSSVVGVHPWQVALFADEAQQAVWGEDQNTRLSSSYAPTGKATLADGGFTLSGRWSFSSGCDHCQWVLLGGLVFNGEGQVVDFRTFMIPRSDYTIEDVWNTVGLRGTGSNDIVVEEVFVPEAFTLSMSDTGRCFGPGQEVNTSNLYKLPFHSIFTMTISTPLIGMAYGAYAEHVEMQRKRVRAAYLAEKTANDPYASVRIARAANEIDSRLGAADAQPPRAPGVRRARRADPARPAAAGCAATRSSPPSAPSGRSTRCSSPPAAARWRRAPTSSGPGATPTPAGCTRRTTPSERWRCSARSSSARRSTRGCTEDDRTDTYDEHQPDRQGRRHHAALPRGGSSTPTRGRRGAAPGDAARRGAGGFGVEQLRLVPRALRGGLPGPARRPAGLRRVRQAGRSRATSSPSPPTSSPRCSTSSASRGCTCSATASAAARRPGSR